MQNLLTLRFWFNLRPEALMTTFFWLFIAMLIVLAAGTIVFGLLQRRKGLYKNAWRKAYEFFFGNLVIGGLLFFFNYERAAFLSARFWLALWLVVMLLWLLPVIKSFRIVPERKKKIAEEQAFKKYLP